MKNPKNPDFSQVPGDFRYRAELDEQGLNASENHLTRTSVLLVYASLHHLRPLWFLLKK